MVTNLDTNL